MIQQKEINVGKLLRVNRVGTWRIEIEDGKAPRFYADAVMDELLESRKNLTGRAIYISSGACTSG